MVSEYKGDLRFSPEAILALESAQDEVRMLRHNYIGTEHILLGLTRQEDTLASRVLANLGVERAKVQSAIEFIIGMGDRNITGEIGLTPKAKKAIELALNEARRNHRQVGPEHLLLGIVREGGGIAAGVLENFGVSLKSVRAEVRRTMVLLQQTPQESLALEIIPPMPVIALRLGSFLNDPGVSRERKTLITRIIGSILDNI